MSDDLISRKIIKAQVEAIRDCWAISPYVSVDDMKLYSEVINVVLQEISDCPTAFDKEKVIEKLKRLEKDTFDYYNRYNDEMAFGESAAFRSVIEIVEKGGIE